MDEPDYIPAATLILGRERGDLPEYLMVRRTSDMAFAGGAWVFPGGRIDAGDHALADGDEIAAAKVAAVRETLEEVGIPVGLTPLPSSQDGRVLQDAVNDGTTLADLVAARGLSLDLGGIAPFARWAPKMQLARRFDTWFMLARVPDGDWDIAVQQSELSEACWTSARAMLERIASGEASAIFPTKRNLERLARFSSLDEAFVDAAAQSLERIVPWVEERDGGKHVCIPDGRGYPVTSEPLDSAVRA